jgi:putative copper resistance protein D
VSCHGEGGLGDGPMAAELAVAPADLTAPHLFFHTDGDLYWFVTAGLDDGQMPSFADRLDETQRWDVINFIKARAGGIVLSLNPKVSADPAPVAPDFTFAAAPSMPGSLRSLLGSQAVLLVLADEGAPLRATFESERGLLADRATAVIVSAESALRTVFALYDSLPATEASNPVAFLIDRNGYIRARWHPGDNPDWLDVASLDEEIDAMSRLPLRATTAAATHIH